MSERSIAIVAAKDARDSVPDELGLLPTAGGIEPVSVSPIRVLGHGRAAEARLMLGKFADGHTELLVEKVFRPGLLTRLIYRLAYQAPFAYQSNDDAILACFYRRRVAAALIDVFAPGTRVAAPLYVRWDAEAQAFVLGSEFIRGRGIIPQDTDPHMLRRWIATIWGSSDYGAAPPEEISELLALMSRLEGLFLESGLTGTGWQVCQRALVSTANLLRTPDGYVSVDLESGIPAVLVPTYFFGGLRLASWPLFDDLNPTRLRAWLASHETELLKTLGNSRHQQLLDDVSQLIEHTARWKQSEPACGRRPWRLASHSFRERFKDQCLNRWQRLGIIDETTAAAIRPGQRIFSRATFLLGLLPGSAGRFLQRLWANQPYRQNVRRFFHDAEFRQQSLAEYVSKNVRNWRSRGRMAPAPSVPESARFNFVFVIHWLLARITPAGLHRWLTDAVHRRNVLARMFLICVSSRFQSEFGRYLIRTRIRDWEQSSRLTTRDAESLRQQLAAQDLDEYVRCFGLHIGLKLLLPVLAPLKLSGAAASLASGNPWYFLAMLMLLPICRTAVTLWRMLVSRRPPIDYVDALLVGVLPVVGSLAYPIQMYARFPDFSAFLLRDGAAQFGRWVPIYGGKDSRVEIAAIKSVNLIAELLSIWLSWTSSARCRAAPTARDHQPAATLSLSIGRWQKLADEQLALIAAEEASTNDSQPIEISRKTDGQQRAA